MDTDSRFTDFVLLQAQSAGLFLGQIPHPTTGKTSVQLEAARSVISSLEMLKDKTKGNLNEEESRLLDSALQNLGTLYAKIEPTTSHE